MINLELLRDAKIWIYDNKVILTDPPDSTRLDAVFPICNESIDLCDHLVKTENARVLDLCTGSAVIAMCAAANASRVVAVDTNPRAIDFARLNVAFNDLDHKIELRLGNLFEAINGEMFDLVTANPPFEPVPAGVDYFLHSDGGPNGSKIAQRICEKVTTYMAEEAVFQMVIYSGAPEDESWYKALAAKATVAVELLKEIDGQRYSEYLRSRIQSAHHGFSDKTFVKTPKKVYECIVTAFKKKDFDREWRK